MARPAMGFTRAKREGDDTEAINKLFAPEFRNRLDAVISFGHLPKEVIQKVVDKFVMQLEAQLADRNVTIELTDEARDWLVEHGYDEAMGARPMARLIQTTIKTPLADDVLFGRLKEGGAVRVVVKTDEIGLKSLGFEYPEGPVIPKPEKDVSNAAKKRSKPKAKTYSKPKKAAKPKGGGDKGGGGPHRSEGAAGPRMTTEARPVPAESAPLDDAAARDAAAPAARKQPPATRPRKSWREERWERRRRRVWFEELLGWILVPLIVIVALLHRRWPCWAPSALRLPPSSTASSAITSNL